MGFQGTLHALNGCLALACHDKPGDGLQDKETTVNDVSQPPATHRDDHPGAGADGQGQNDAVLRQADGIDRRVLPGRHPLLQDERAGRRGQDLETNEQEPRQE